MAPAAKDLTYGYFEFGGTATLVDPRGTGNRHPELTFVHEQAHRDLANATVYGYVLSRLNELAVLQLASEHKPGALLEQLTAGIWQCAEGSATTLELMTARPKLSAAEIDKLVADLPPDYQAALDIFRPIAEMSCHPLPAPFDLLLLTCLNFTVAETAADWAVFTRRPLPDEFWALVAHLLTQPRPDDVLPRLVRDATAISMASHCAALDAAKAGITDFASGLMTYSRNVIRETKQTLLRRSGINFAMPLAVDDARIDFIAAVDGKLEATYPQLHHVTRIKGVVTGAEAAVEIGEPPFLLADEELPAAAIPARYRELALAQGFQHFVNEFYLDARTNVRSVMTKPIHLTPRGLDCGSPYLICLDAPEAMLRALEATRIPHVWQAPGFPTNAGGFYDYAFIRTLAAPVYLQLTSFSWENARRMLGGADKALDATLFNLPLETGLAVAALRDKTITVFGITAENFPQDYTPGQQTRRTPIEDDPLLGSVAMVVLRSSHANAIVQPKRAQ